VLERLPVVMPPPPAWEAEYHQFMTARKLARGHLRQLPEVLAERRSGAAQTSAELVGAADPPPAGGDAAGAAAGAGAEPPAGDAEPAAGSAAAAAAAAAETAADRSGDRRTMKRALTSRVFLLLRDAEGRWGFPAAPAAPGETIRQTAERALRAGLGPRAPAYMIGNAPMGHHAPPGGDAPTFFMLAQVLLDPWEVALAEGGGYTDHAWVTREELPAYLGDDAALAALAQAML